MQLVGEQQYLGQGIEIPSRSHFITSLLINNRSCCSIIFSVKESRFIFFYRSYCTPDHPRRSSEILSVTSRSNGSKFIGFAGEVLISTKLVGLYQQLSCE